MTQTSDATLFNVGDFGQVELVEGEKRFVGKSVAQLKTALGLPSKIFVAKLTFGNNATYLNATVANNTFEGNWAFTKETGGALGTYYLTSPNSTSKSKKNYQITITAPQASRNLTWTFSSTGTITFLVKDDSGTLIDAISLVVDIVIEEYATTTNYYGGVIL